MRNGSQNWRRLHSNGAEMCRPAILDTIFRIVWPARQVTTRVNCLRITIVKRAPKESFQRLFTEQALMFAKIATKAAIA